MPSTVCPVPKDYPSEIIGYTYPWIVSPGDSVDVKVSTTASEYTYETVRLVQGLEDPDGPPVKIESIPEAGSGKKNGRFQLGRPGSYALVENCGLSADDDGVVVKLYVQPFLSKSGHTQTVFSTLGTNGFDGVAIVLAEDGQLKLLVGNGESLVEKAVPYPIVDHQWLRLDLSIIEKSVTLSISPIIYLGHSYGEQYSHTETMEKPVRFSTSNLTIGASRPSLENWAKDFFNGKVEAVTIASQQAGKSKLLTRLDFYLKMSTRTVVDTSGNGNHGVLINGPSRAVTGHNWDGCETDWTKSSFGYGAIHFHEDDIDDARWETDFTIQIPANARSGAYAVKVQNVDDPTVLDNITFFVRPNPSSTAKLAFVLSTFTYTAYANEHMYDQTKSSELIVPEGLSRRDDEDFRRLQRRSDLGLSLYDVHKDGSGSVYSTTKRPVLNVRPGYRHWGIGRPREFSSDLLMIGYIEELGIPYDILTDHDLHAKGIAGLRQYNTLVTGSHPEYPSIESLNAYSEFTARGGNLMYLGGNGFYWVSVPDPSDSHRIEVRRADQGVRTFGMPGNEWNNSFTGSRGGLWRSCGRAANYLVGLGCCGEGMGPGKPYKRNEISYDKQLAWMFKGIESDELLGDFGFGGGASGDEIDRWDPQYGSPRDAFVIASSLRHSKYFGLFPEDFGYQDYADGLFGPDTDKIRSDIVYYKTPSGGKVFSVGSMEWFNAVGWAGYKNNVAILTGNVLKNFVGV